MRVVGLCVVLALFAGCKTEVKTQDNCGDEFLDPGEACDGANLGGQDCVSLGHYGNTGAPVCTSACTFDTSACGPRCGDNTVDVAHGEVCDSQQLTGNTCVTLGFTSGVLACGANCQYDVSGCANVCGDGVAQTGEACDVSDLRGQTCVSLGYYGGTLACATDCTPDLSPCELAGRCGDGYLNDYEGCDQDSFPPSMTCSTERLFSGQLTCTEDCVLDLSGCHGAVALSTGQSHVCVLDDLGLAYCWGAGGGGRLGDGGTANRDRPVPVVMPQGISFSSVSAGTAHTCALDTAGAAWCWGSGLSGRLGNGAVTNQTTPTPVTMPAGRTFTAIAAGDSHTCAIDNRGQGWCWGAGGTGQLGNGQTMTEAIVPTAVTMPLATTFTAITAGHGHTCAITDTAALRCWGYNNVGQVGNNQNNNTLPTPTDVVAPGIGFIQVDAGYMTTCAVSVSGEPYCWGFNNRGQVGDGTTTNRLVPFPVLMPGGFPSSRVAVHAIHACALSVAGELHCWGGGEDGELGLGQVTETLEPTLVGYLSNDTVFAMDARDKGTCVLAGEGMVWCWGTNDLGQLGLGYVGGGPYDTPMPVESP